MTGEVHPLPQDHPDYDPFSDDTDDQLAERLRPILERQWRVRP